MKNLYFSLLLVLTSATFAQAQTTFALPTDTVYASIEAPEITAAAPDTVFNLMAGPISINWTRFVLSISPNCVIQVCDPNNCYLPTVGSKTFTIPANGLGHMTIDLVDTLLSGNPVNAVVRLKYTNINLTSDTTNVYYFLSITATVGTNDPASAVRAVAYPNPVTESFTLDHAEGVHTVRLFDLNGRQVAEYNATSTQRYSLAGQPAGTYFAALADAQGRVLKALQIVKQ